MNIPIEVARTQGKHGIKGAVHGTKGGRPKLDLTDEQRAERRRKQKEAYRRRKGIKPRERKMDYWTALYIKTWGKPPGEPLTKEEFKEREPYFLKWVAETHGS